ncbi:MAG: hypothetical protein CMJ48_06925 [Planctomycetaceae bacterium]|nr:hypothetical protein [Planctomycetaceae bacterium]
MHDFRIHPTRHRPMTAVNDFLHEHSSLTRRYFLRCGAAGVVALGALPLSAEQKERDPKLQTKIDGLQSWLTRLDDFRNVSRGNPKPDTFDEAKRKELALTRETWSLEVIPDPEKPARIGKPLTKKEGTAFDFKTLMQLAEKHAVRFPKVMTCLNLGKPLGMGIWEGVPLREVIWLTQPRDNLRRVFFDGYHNDDPKQLFRSSLSINRVLEDLNGLPPVILCYRLNGQWLTPQRGAPVRMVVPESYGFKNIKWLTHLFLSNRPNTNDTYQDANNDVHSPLKTFCGTLSVPKTVKPDQPIPVTGYAQVGIAGLKKVQVWIHNDKDKLPADDKHFTQAPWRDAEILPPPKNWGGDLPDNQIPPDTHDFNESGQPRFWPIRLAKAHWAALLPGLPPGEYTLRCRTIDENDHAQPMPRPFRKSGRAKIEQTSIVVKS